MPFTEIDGSLPRSQHAVTESYTEREDLDWIRHPFYFTLTPTPAYIHNEDK